MIKHLYIHVPFCNNICGYCDFAHTIINKELVNKYLLSLKEDLSSLSFSNFETIYIGGGTPSSLDYADLKKILELIRPFSSSVVEYTIEVNPDSMDEDKIKLLKEYGVNRVSIGVESTDDYLLKIMNI